VVFHTATRDRKEFGSEGVASNSGAVSWRGVGWEKRQTRRRPSVGRLGKRFFFLVYIPRRKIAQGETGEIPGKKKDEQCGGFSRILLNRKKSKATKTKIQTRRRKPQHGGGERTTASRYSVGAVSGVNRCSIENTRMTQASQRRRISTGRERFPCSLHRWARRKVLHCH